MMPRPFLGIPTLAGILAVVCAAPARAAELGCVGLRLEVEAEVERRFPDLADRVREAFSARDDMETCPEVKLAFARQEIQLRVALADGRAAERTLARAEDVVPTLQALVIVPERTDAAVPERSFPDAPAPVATTRPTKARARSARTTRRTPARDAVVADRGVPSPTVSAEPSALRIELSAAVGAHSGENSRSSLNFGVQSLLDIHRFLAGFQVRLDQYQAMAEGMGGALELAALGGRRFELGVVALDVLLGPSLAFQTSSSTDVAAREGAEVTRLPPPPTNEGGGAVFAFLGLRGSFFPNSNLRPFMSGDAALRLDTRESPDSDVFPTWTVGVSVGATVGTL
jgi:hypothetical protein